MEDKDRIEKIVRMLRENNMDLARQMKPGQDVSHHQKSVEKERSDSSSWSGASGSGGVWAGRDRHRER